jgi:outer membrane protein
MARSEIAILAIATLSHRITETAVMSPNLGCRVTVHFICLFVLSTAVLAQENLSFQRAVELALAHSSQMAVTQANEAHAYQTYIEARDAYVPKLATGSDVGYAYGFPLSLEGSAPTLFNVSTQSAVWNPSLRDFTKAAKVEWSATKALTRGQRSQVIADTAIIYIDLNRWESRLPILQAELEVAQNMEYAVAERVKEGIDKIIERTRAELVEAQVQMHLTEAQGEVDILRTQLSQLTGVPASSIRTVRDSIPVLKENKDQSDLVMRAVQFSPAVEAAEQSAMAKLLNAKGEHHALYPSADFSAQYGLINTALTNYEQFFVPRSFQTQNVTFGLVLRFPFLDRSQRARAAAADADALRARKEAEQTKNKAIMDALQQQHNVEQLEAAQHIADLRSKLSQNELDAAHARMEAETATQRELQNAALDAGERTLERINADFEVQRAEVELLRTRGEIETWAPTNK